MKPKTISHSSKEKYHTCGKMYDLHYNQRIRSKTVSSALVFGGAIDQAFNALLDGQSLTEANLIFESAWYSSKVNGQEVVLSNTSIIEYYKADCNLDLLDESDVKVLDYLNPKSKIESLALLFQIIENLDRHMNFKSDVDVRLFQKACWLSLRQKGLLFLKTYHDKILPLFDKVIKTQIPVKLYDESGNTEINGFADFIATLKTDPTTNIIFDNKSASKPYKSDAVQNSEQLSLYSFVLGAEYNTNTAGYIVLNKTPKKNVLSRTCIKCKTSYPVTTRKKTCSTKNCNGHINENKEIIIDFQVLTCYISPEQEQKTLEGLSKAVDNIAEASFEPNFEACHNQFGRKCVYFDLCHKNSMDGLIKL